MNDQALNPNIAIFHEERLPGDIDLVQEVANKMLAKDIPGIVVDIFTQDKDILMARSKRPNVQRHMINSFWRLQLSTITDIDTTGQRHSLIPDGDNEFWLTLFEQHVLPTIIDFGRPIKIK